MCINIYYLKDVDILPSGKKGLKIESTVACYLLQRGNMYILVFMYFHVWKELIFNVIYI